MSIQPTIRGHTDRAFMWILTQTNGPVDKFDKHTRKDALSSQIAHTLADTHKVAYWTSCLKLDFIS